MSNHYSESQNSRRMQPNTDRYSRWSEDDDRMDRDERYARDDGDQDRFNKYTRGAPYSTYGNMNQGSSGQDHYRGSSSDYYRDQGRNSSDSYQGYSRAASQSNDQSPYQNFGRSQNFSDQSRNSGYGQGGTYNYGGNPSGYSSQNQVGSQSYGQGYGYDQGMYGQGQRSFNTQNQGWSSSRYNPSFGSRFGSQGQSVGSQGNGYGSHGSGYSSGSDYGSGSNYGRYGSESQGFQGQGYGSGIDSYQGQSYSSGSQSSDWGKSNFGGGNYQSSPWSGSDRAMSSRSGKAPKGYKRSDERIKEEICDLLTNAPHVDPSDLEVKVSAGEVTLTGTVEDRMEKRMAEDLASTISGVTEVHNQLRVSQSDRHSRTQGQSFGHAQNSSSSASSSLSSSSGTGSASSMTDSSKSTPSSSSSSKSVQ
jgi:osmotically-inducible protein OsmY